MGVNQKPKSSLTIPNQKQKGLDNHAEADPVIAKTTNMTPNCQLDVSPQRCFNPFIFKTYFFANIRGFDGCT
ncbi:hypothetical protein D3C85_1915960 [compost metagenome]